MRLASESHRCTFGHSAGIHYHDVSTCNYTNSQQIVALYQVGLRAGGRESWEGSGVLESSSAGHLAWASPTGERGDDLIAWIWERSYGYRTLKCWLIGVLEVRLYIICAIFLQPVAIGCCPKHLHHNMPWGLRNKISWTWSIYVYE